MIDWQRAPRLWGVFVEIWLAGEEGTTTPEICRSLQLRPNLAYRMCQRLEQEGYVVREWDPSEGSPGRGPVRWVAA